MQVQFCRPLQHLSELRVRYKLIFHNKNSLNVKNGKYFTTREIQLENSAEAIRDLFCRVDALRQICFLNDGSQAVNTQFMAFLNRTGQHESKLFQLIAETFQLPERCQLICGFKVGQDVQLTLFLDSGYLKSLIYAQQTQSGQSSEFIYQKI